MDKKNNIALVVIFLVTLILPNIIMLYNFEDDNKLPKPDLNSPMATAKKYKKYFTENFGFKELSLNTYIDFKTEVLNEDPIPHNVIKGKDGWYFLGNRYNYALDNAFGNYHFMGNELNQISDNIEEITHYLKSRGIKFYLVVIPNKSTIYSEKLPYTLQRNKTRLDILKSHLSEGNQFEIIDLRNQLSLKKEEQQLYIKTDTHWNDYGAFIGYSEVVEKIKKEMLNSIIPKRTIDDYTIQFEQIKDGDIVKMINSDIQDIRLNLIDKNPDSSIIVKNDSYGLEHYINPNNNFKILMHRDSFANAWINFFNASFRESVYVRGYQLDKELIDKIKPDIVVFQIVERNLTQLVK